MNLVEKLLQVDKAALKERRIGTFKSGNLQRLIGDYKVEIGEIDPERATELSTGAINNKGDYDFSRMYQSNLCIVVEGVIAPDLSDKKLQDHFGVANAADLAKLLFRSEVPEIAGEILALGASEVIEEEEAKN